MRFKPPLPFLAVGLLLLTAADAKPKYTLGESFAVGGDGRWDMVAVDSPSHLLYVPRSNHTQVIDTTTGKVVSDLPGGKRLHGVAIAAGKAFVTDGGAGVVLVFDQKTAKPLGTIAAADDADGIVYDPGAGMLLISCGDSAKLLLLDPKADVATAKCDAVTLPGKAEFLVGDGKGKAFVCLNELNQIAAVDLKSLKVTAAWTTGTGTVPTGLAIDAEHGRLFVGCRNKKLIVMSTETGAVLTELSIGKGVDACAFDPATGEAFASCGDSTVAIIAETTDGKLDVIQTLETKPGARTMALDPATHQIYLPTAEFMPEVAGKRPVMKPGTFLIVTAKAG